METEVPDTFVEIFGATPHKFNMESAKGACAMSKMYEEFVVTGLVLGMSRIDGVPKSVRADVILRTRKEFRRKRARIVNHAEGYPSVRGIIRKSNKSRKGW